MNIYDSNRLAGLLEQDHYYITDCLEQADLVVLNTCHIREKAAEKIYSDIGRFQIKNKHALFAVTGCVAQAEAEEIFTRAPRVRLICGSQAYHLFPNMLKRALINPNARIIETDFSVEKKFDTFLHIQRQNTSGFLSIQEGCDKFCTYCVVPYTRGAEFSRPVHDIIEEAKIMIHNGTKEITLLGQNVNAYCHNRITLAQLIARLHELKGLERIRYMTSHPLDMKEDLIEAHAVFPKLMPFVHLPIQSGSDKILKMMNRKHTVAYYKTLIDRMRLKKENIAFSSDFIVGFPGETDEDFQQTINLIRDVRFSASYSFKFSARPGTPAFNYPPVPDHIANERLKTLQTILMEDQLSFNTSFIGKKLDILFDKKGRCDEQWVGRSIYMQPVHIYTSDQNLIGKIRSVFIERVKGFSLFGCLEHNKN